MNEYASLSDLENQKLTTYLSNILIESCINYINMTRTYIIFAYPQNKYIKRFGTGSNRIAIIVFLLVFSPVAGIFSLFHIYFSPFTPIFLPKPHRFFPKLKLFFTQNHIVFSPNSHCFFPNFTFFFLQVQIIFDLLKILLFKENTSNIGNI